MPVGYRIFTDSRVVISTAEGLVTDEELLTNQGRLREDPEFEGSFWQLWDLRAADLDEVSIECIMKLARPAIFDSGSRRAIVVGTDLAHGLANMFCTFRAGSGEDIRVFRDIGHALTWLEMD